MDLSFNYLNISKAVKYKDNESLMQKFQDILINVSAHES